MEVGLKNDVKQEFAIVFVPILSGRLGQVSFSWTDYRTKAPRVDVLAMKMLKIKPTVVKVTMLQRKSSSIYIFSNHVCKKHTNSAQGSCAKSIYTIRIHLNIWTIRVILIAFMDNIFCYSTWLWHWKPQHLPKKCWRIFLGLTSVFY